MACKCFGFLYIYFVILIDYFAGLYYVVSNYL